MENLKTQDERVYNAIQQELGRQRDKIELIASENFVSEAVMEAQGSVLTNKYAEAIQVAGTTVAVSMSILSKISPAIEQKKFLVPRTQMFSLILVLRQIWVYITRFLSMATRFWG